MEAAAILLLLPVAAALPVVEATAGRPAADLPVVVDTADLRVDLPVAAVTVAPLVDRPAAVVTAGPLVDLPAEVAMADLPAAADMADLPVATADLLPVVTALPLRKASAPPAAASLPPADR